MPGILSDKNYTWRWEASWLAASYPVEEDKIKHLSTCIGDATRLWNQAPNNIRSAKTLYSAKMETKNTARLYLYKFKLKFAFYSPFMFSFIKVFSCLRAINIIIILGFRPYFQPSIGLLRKKGWGNNVA